MDPDYHNLDEARSASSEPTQPTQPTQPQPAQPAGPLHPSTTVPQRTPPARRSALLWVVLGVLAYMTFVMQLVGFPPERLPDPVSASSLQVDLTGRYLLGVDQLGDALGMRDMLAGQTGTAVRDLATWDSPIHDQLRVSALLAEFDSPQAALDRLDLIEERLAAMRAEAEFDLLIPDSTAVLEDAQDELGSVAEPANEDEADAEDATETEPSPIEDAGADATSDEDDAPVDQIDEEIADDPLANYDEYQQDVDELRAMLVALTSAPADDPAPALPLDADQRDRLVERHGFSAELLISRFDGEAPLRERLESAGVRMIAVLGTFFLSLGIAGVLGLVLLVIFLVKISGRTMRPRYDSAPHAPHRPHVYLETTALFLGGFIVLQVVLGLVVAIIDLAAGGLNSGVLDGLPLLMWLLALATLWPLYRGVSFSELRQDMGWHMGEGLFKEIGAGLVAYLAGLPLIAIGLGLVVLISAITTAQPTHPISGGLESGGVWTIVVLYLLAAVWAPVVEESIFRGALYHHLRSRVGAGVLASAVASGFLFAVIHPQGFAGVPALLALAVVLALMREWRGSLVAPVFIHALHNATILTLVLLVLS